MPPLSQSNLIEKGRWERVLFTTYSLSLTYFEAYLLPKFWQAGCQQITILADTEGYRASMMEAQAQHVGRGYALIPVANTRGIFHPKLTYLWSSDGGDLLLVGSGNLTYQGHGRNLEVLDALCAGTDGQAFQEFAAFLEALLRRPGLMVAQTDTLKDLSARAAFVGGKGKPGTTHLLHTVERSVYSQLLELAKPHSWDELFVLSPFHSATGDPILSIAKDLGIARLQVGVPSEGTRTSFPFEKARNCGLTASAVCAVDEKERRPIHAKWLELRGATSWALAGSVNATQQSMGTTDNIEVGVLRELAEPSRKLWRTTSQPEYVPDVFEAGRGPVPLSIFAELTASETITGRILGRGPLAGDWSICIETDHGSIPASGLNVLDDGSFSWRVPSELSLPETVTGVQLRMGREGQTARGWLHLEAELRLSVAARRARDALRRMLAGVESTDDLQAFIGYLSQHTDKVLAEARARPAKGVAQNQPTPASQTAANVGEAAPAGVSLAELLALKHKTPEQLLRDATASDHQAEQILDSIARLLLGPRQLSGSPINNGRNANEDRLPEDDDDDKSSRDPAQQWKSARRVIAEFREKVCRALQAEGLETRRRTSVVLAWGHALLDMYLHRFGERQLAKDFVPELFNEAVRYPRDPEDPRLDELVFGTAAVLASHPEPTQVHGALEAYVGGPVETCLAVACADGWLAQAGHALLVENTAAALESLLTALARPTRRAVLAQIVQAKLNGAPTTVPTDLFLPEERRLLEAVKPVKSGKPCIYELDLRKLGDAKRTPSCPHCHVTLRAPELKTLAYRRLLSCLGCTRLLVFTRP